MRIIETNRAEWPEEPAFLLTAAHWQRMAGYGDGANEALLRAAALEDSFGIAEEARILEITPQRPPPEPHPASILLDIQDLLQFLHETGNISGIQRVQLGILAAMLQGRAGPRGGNCIAVFPALAHGALFAPRPADMQALLAYCTGTRRDVALARPLVEQLRSAALRVTPRSGAAFLVLGAHWFFAGAPGFYASLRAQGVRLGVLIYDMFPASHPQFTTTDTTSFFNQSLNEGLFFWDFAFAISEYSASAFRRIAAQRGYPAIETVPIPLAHSFGLERPPRPGWLRDWPAALGDLEGRDYILAVSTIEARKNHQLLFHAWARMIEEGDNPPPLVLVGRPGWRVGDLIGQLDATRYLNGRIMIVHGLSDAALEAVYRGCLFTLMPSFAEGWGLAVGESLSFGRACIAANTAALPEVGGDLVTYADPLDVPAWITAIRAWLHNRPALAAMQARIMAEFTPRQWPEVTRHLLDETARLQALPPRQAAPPATPLLLALGQQSSIGIAVASQGQDAQGASLTLSQAVSLASGWFPCEAGGTWMRGRFAQLLAETDAAPGSTVTVTLLLSTPGWPMDNTVTLQIEGGSPARHTVPQHGPFEISVSGALDGSAMLRLHLQLERPGEQHGADMRQLCIALQRITITAAEAPAPAQPEPPPEEAPPPAPMAEAPPAPQASAIPRRRLPRLTFPTPAWRLRKQANLARDGGHWAEAARLYAAYLQRRPQATAILVQLGNMRSMAGEHASAIESLSQAAALGEPDAPTMLAHAQARALPATLPEGPGTIIDISAVLAPPPGAPPAPILGHGLSRGSWAARQWRLGLAQSLAQSLARQPQAGLRFAVIDQMQGGLQGLPQRLAHGLLTATPDQQRQMLAELAGRLESITAGPGDRVLVLGVGPSQAVLAQARARGARVSLVLAEPMALTTPHRVAADLVAALHEHASFDALLLAMPAGAAAPALADIGRATLPMPPPLLPQSMAGEAPPGRYIIADGAPPWLQEAWMLLRASQPNLPALLGLDGPLPAIGMAGVEGLGPLPALIAGAQCLLATATDGSWPALALAAAQARRPCLGVAEADGLDPLDSRATAQAIAAMLLPEAQAARVIAQDIRMTGPQWQLADWDALAQAALRFADDPPAALAPPMAPAPAPASAPASAPGAPQPAAPQQIWALAASHGSGQGRVA